MTHNIADERNDCAAGISFIATPHASQAL